MTLMIILTAEQADVVRGEGNNNSYLSPIFYMDYYVLPVSVLDDADYEDRWNYLKQLPQQEIIFNDDSI